MYIVQINNPQRHSWRKLEATKCEFRSLDKAIALYRSIKAAPQYQGLNVRIWSTEADHRVEVSEGRGYDPVLGATRRSVGRR